MTDEDHSQALQHFYSFELKNRMSLDLSIFTDPSLNEHWKRSQKNISGVIVCSPVTVTILGILGNEQLCSNRDEMPKMWVIDTPPMEQNKTIILAATIFIKTSQFVRSFPHLLGLFSLLHIELIIIHILVSAWFWSLARINSDHSSYPVLTS